MPDKDEIFDYVMNNPENTNPAILRGMLDNLGGGSGSSGSLFFVSIVVDDTDPDNPIFFTKSRTFGEIKEAAESGSFVYASCRTEGSKLMIAPLNNVTTPGPSGGMLAFCNGFGFELSLYAASDDDIPTSVRPAPLTHGELEPPGGTV